METIQKYIMTANKEIVLFPCSIAHNLLDKLKPVSAGYCRINRKKKIVECYGEASSIKLKSNEKIDSEVATFQIFGIDAALAVLKL